MLLGGRRTKNLRSFTRYTARRVQDDKGEKKQRCRGEEEQRRIQNGDTGIRG
jgi:hypothetical protein